MCSARMGCGSDLGERGLGPGGAALSVCLQGASVGLQDKGRPQAEARGKMGKDSLWALWCVPEASSLPSAAPSPCRAVSASS